MCLSVCHTVFTPFQRLPPPLPEVQCPNFLDIQNPLGEIMERSGLRFEHFCSKIVLKRCRKNFFNTFFFFICSLSLNIFMSPFPKVQCPNFLYFWNPWGKAIERSGLRFKNKTKRNAHKCKFCLTSRIFLVSVLLSALVERFRVSRIRHFSRPKFS